MTLITNQKKTPIYIISLCDHEYHLYIIYILNQDHFTSVCVYFYRIDASRNCTTVDQLNCPPKTGGLRWRRRRRLRAEPDMCACKSPTSFAVCAFAAAIQMRAPIKAIARIDAPHATAMGTSNVSSMQRARERERETATDREGGKPQLWHRIHNQKRTCVTSAPTIRNESGTPPRIREYDCIHNSTTTHRWCQTLHMRHMWLEIAVPHIGETGCGRYLWPVPMPRSGRLSNLLFP